MHKIDVEFRFRCLDLAPNFADDFVDAAFALVLEFDGEVTRIGFRNGKDSKLQAGAARRAFDFRSLADDALDVAENAIGFLK